MSPLRRILLPALAALALAGCVHHEGSYRHAGYGYGPYPYGYAAGWRPAPWQPVQLRPRPYPYYAHDPAWGWPPRRHAWWQE
jgi:hypothetical protein